jgi:integrase
MAKPKGFRRFRDGRARATVFVTGLPQSRKRFPRGTTDKEIRDWREEERQRLRQEAKRQVIEIEERKSLEHGFRFDALERYLPAVTAMPSYHHRVREIHAWIREFGDRPRSTITPLEIRTILQRWFSEEGPNVHVRQLKHGGRRPQTFSARSCNLHRTALCHLWNVLDGEMITDGYGRNRPIARNNPVRPVPKFRLPDAEPRALDPLVVREIFGQMRMSKTKTRLLAIVAMGIRHQQLMQIQPDTDIRDGKLFIRSSKQNKATRVPLTREAIEALRLMERWAAWGRFSQPSALRSLRLAIQKANAARRAHDPKADIIPLTTRAYDLRHTFATEVMRSSKNIHAVKELLTHTSLALTERYLLAVVPESLREAVRDLPQLTDIVLPKTRSKPEKLAHKISPAGKIR